jgi:transcriptional regulator with XRE-family HTH domain
MDIIIDEAATRLAHQIKQEREARGWSLADLAAESGVAKASISKIERGEVSPSAVILLRLATAFDLTLAGLLLRTERDKGLLSRAEDQPQWRDPATGYRRRQLFMHAGHPVELVQVEMPPGQQVAFPASSYARIRQTVWVQKGELTVTEASAAHLLKSGDCLGFGPPSDVTLANKSSKPCLYVIALARS